MQKLRSERCEVQVRRSKYHLLGDLQAGMDAKGISHQSTTKRKQMTIKIKPLTVNRCWQGRRFKTPDYTAYEHEFLTLLSIQHEPFAIYEKMWITIIAGLSYKKADIDNIVKPILDILQKKYGFDDNTIYKLTAIKKIVDKGSEYITISTSPWESDEEAKYVH